MTTLAACEVTWSAGRTRILDRIELAVGSGEMLGLLGPNGAGKTSLLHLLAGLRRADRGSVLVDGMPVQGFSRRTLARRLAFVEQSPQVHTELTVQEAVSLGRTPHRGTFASWGSADRAAIEDALALTGMTPFRTRSWRTLSGGERQRAQLARALAQQPDAIVLDEPTNHLDIRYQLDVLSLLRSLDLTVVTALHDLNLAARFCDRVAVLREGRVVTAGTPQQVLTAELIRSVYAVEAVVEASSHTGAPVATYLAATAGHGAQPG